ncbi:MAG TPA: type II toxin-antitoxin system PemK/MazF family toxin [Candidatus Wallbacteria bacterium]|nr:type II toxin-antitoxin system PemK/MazF family toxin [Candidatus Wallbacteria bacterium]
MVAKQYDIFLISLDPTLGHEINKTRPCLIVSPDEINDNIGTVIVAPMTTKSFIYPTRIPVNFDGKKGLIILDQIRTIDKRRLVKKLGVLDKDTVLKVKNILKEMLVD